MTITKQEIFNKVWNHFIVGKNPPGYDVLEARCRYRGPNGEKCAFGIFIPDELYHHQMESRPVTTVICTYPTLREHLGNPDEYTNEFYQTIQSLHDNAVTLRLCEAQPEDVTARFTPRFTEGLLKFAMEQNLKVPLNRALAGGAA